MEIELLPAIITGVLAMGLLMIFLFVGIPYARRLLARDAKTMFTNLEAAGATFTDSPELLRAIQEQDILGLKEIAFTYQGHPYTASHEVENEALVWVVSTESHVPEDYRRHEKGAVIVSKGGHVKLTLTQQRVETVTPEEWRTMLEMMHPQGG